MSLVTSDWLENNLSDVKIIDCSWHMPGIDRNPKEEYSKNHIPGAIFFDLDKNSDQDTDLPHMLPAKEKWEEIVSSMGISNTDRIVIYDNSDVLSSCRGWYNFIYFGHDKHLVSVLDGGLKKWLIENRKTTSEKTNLNKSNYKSTENKNLVKSILEVNENIEKKNFTIIINIILNCSSIIKYFYFSKLYLDFLNLFYRTKFHFPQNQLQFHLNVLKLHDQQLYPIQMPLVLQHNHHTLQLQ